MLKFPGLSAKRGPLYQCFQVMLGREGLMKLQVLLKAELSLQQATPDLGCVSDGRCKDRAHRSRSNCPSHVSKETLASASAEGVLGRAGFPIAFCWLMLQPSLSLLTVWINKPELGPFQLPMPSRAQVKSRLKLKLFQGMKLSKKCYTGSRLHSTELRRALLPP